MKETLQKIEFSKMGGPLFSGRSRGEKNREKYKLDMLDTSKEVVEVLIPDDTYSVTSSFFLGLFGPSVRKFGSRDKFLNKYKLEIPERFREKINTYIDWALREKKPLI